MKGYCPECCLEYGHIESHGAEDCAWAAKVMRDREMSDHRGHMEAVLAGFFLFVLAVIWVVL